MLTGQDDFASRLAVYVFVNTVLYTFLPGLDVGRVSDPSVPVGSASVLFDTVHPPLDTYPSTLSTFDVGEFEEVVQHEFCTVLVLSSYRTSIGAVSADTVQKIKSHE